MNPGMNRGILVQNADQEFISFLKNSIFSKRHGSRQKCLEISLEITSAAGNLKNLPDHVRNHTI